MTDREKLIELVGQVQDCGCDVTDVVEMNYVENSVLVDHLIANGVTMRERGRWEDRYGGKYANPFYECSVCKKTIIPTAVYKIEVDLLGHEHIVQALTDFCPNCGADMRGVEDA